MEEERVKLIAEYFAHKMVIIWATPTAVPMSSGEQAQNTFTGFLEKIHPYGIILRSPGDVEDTFRYFPLEAIVGIEGISKKNLDFAQKKRENDAKQGCPSGCGHGHSTNS